MIEILSVTFPFFALIAIGYLAARTRALPATAVPGLNTFVLYFALTGMLFKLGQRTPTSDLLDPAVLGLWVAAGLAVMALAVVPGRRRGLGWRDAAFGGLIAVLPNSGFMGVPLLMALLGAQAAGPISASLLVDVALMQSVAVALAHYGRRAEGGSLWRELAAQARRVAGNPMPWAIVLGGLASGFSVRLPGPVDAVVAMLAASATPVALFTIGAMLAREGAPRASGVRGGSGGGFWRRRGQALRAATGDDVAWLATCKLFAHPLLMWGLGRGMIAAGLPLGEGALTVLTLTAALPAAANVAVLAERYGADSGRVARVILISTVVSFATFTVAVALLT